MKVEYSRESSKFLKRCDKILEKRLNLKIIQLRNDPYLGSKRLSGYANTTYRTRVGDYRIIYEVNLISSTIFIIKISKRSTVYRIKDNDDYSSEEQIKKQKTYFQQ